MTLLTPLIYFPGHVFTAKESQTAADVASKSQKSHVHVKLHTAQDIICSSQGCTLKFVVCFYGYSITKGCF